MRICIFISGHIRTLFYKFHENLLLIKEKVGDCEIDIFYSFWDDYGRSESINDPWHYSADDFVQQVVNRDNIICYLRGCGGANNVSGEIQSVEVMKEVLEKTHFSPEANGKNSLSSQYYKKHRVVDKFYSDEYDFYIQMRSDITISNFLSREDIEQIKDVKTLVVNSYYWYNEKYTGGPCNEMIWCSGKKVFKKSNEIYLNEKDLSEQLPYQYGELVTGTHFNNLLNSGFIDNVMAFDFGFRVIR
tara:strand:+ start:1442 stop:2176 length:735 start_codon:yes stop_codon:yes gene_type:complete